MNVKNIVRLFCLFWALVCWACIDDGGNYTYRDPDSVLPIEILGLSDTTFKVLANVTLTPEIKGMEDEDNYEFIWYAYPVGAAGFVPQRDTLGTTRNLTFVMKYPAGEKYMLVYQIRDKKTDLFVNKKIMFNGASDFARGWFVVNDENDRTDIDFVFPDGTEQEDLLSQYPGIKLSGTAVKIAYQLSGYTHQITNPDGTVTTLTNKKALHVLSSKDLVTLNPDNMSVYKRAEDEFYSAPEWIIPQDICVNSRDIFFMNAGLIHTIYGMSGNIGKFGFPKFDNVDLFPKLVLFGFGNPYVLAFSRDTRSFVMADTWSSYTSELLEASGEDLVTISPTEMNVDMVSLLSRAADFSAAKAWALMKSISGPEEYYLADISFNGRQYPFVDFDTISTDRELVHADVYGAHLVNSIYFAKGNVLSYYQKNASDADSYEKTDIYPFPEEETITYIEQVKSGYGSKNPFNNLVVVTNSGSGWKLYRFELEGEGTSPNILPGGNPVVYSGKGFARYVMYIE